MGFPRESCTAALLANNGNEEAALNGLLTAGPDTGTAVADGAVAAKPAAAGAKKSSSGFFTWGKG